MSLDDALKFINKFNECVIATVDSGSQPEAATVGFSFDEQYNFLIATNGDTRKAQNILQNDKVAIVIGFEGPATLQINATAVEVSAETHSDRIKMHLEIVPRAKDFANEEGQTYFLLSPTWLRFTDYTQKPPIFETTEFRSNL